MQKMNNTVTTLFITGLFISSGIFFIMLSLFCIGRTLCDIDNPHVKKQHLVKILFKLGIAIILGGSLSFTCIGIGVSIGTGDISLSNIFY